MTMTASPLVALFPGLPPDDSIFEIPGWRACVAPDTPEHGLFRYSTRTSAFHRALATAAIPLCVVKVEGTIVGIRVRMVPMTGPQRTVFVAEAFIRSRLPADALHVTTGDVYTPVLAKRLQEFLGAALQFADLPVEKAMARPGWDGDALLLPGVLPLIPADRWLTAYYRPKAGANPAAREAWREIVYRAAAYPKLAMNMGAAAGSLYVAPLGLSSSNLHDVGDSRIGKTLAAKIAACIFGDPDELMLSWNTTANGLTAKLERAAILPVFVDETGAANMKAATFEAIVFGAASGKGRNRASRDGSAREVGSWASVLISTGERGLVSSSALSGARARVLELQGPMTPDAASIDAIYEMARAHCGAPACWLVDTPRLDAARLVYADVRERLVSEIAGSSIDATLLSNAALYVTGFVLLAVAVDADVLNAELITSMSAVLQESIGTMRAEGATASERLYAAIVEDVAAHHSRYNGEDPRDTSGWWHTANVLCLLPGAAKRIAENIGLMDPTPAFRGLRDQKLLIPGDGVNLQKKVRYQGVSQRVYTIRFDRVPSAPSGDR